MSLETLEMVYLGEFANCLVSSKKFLLVKCHKVSKVRTLSRTVIAQAECVVNIEEEAG